MTSSRLRMESVVKHIGDVTIITFADGTIGGEETSVTGKLVAGVPAELGQRHLVLDLRDVYYITSGQLSTLLALHKKCNAAGGRLTLANVGPEIYDVCQRIKLNNILDVRRQEAPKVETPRC
jgi:anti-anti-sigma factor